jgi:type IV secretion system protein VirB1
MPFPKQAHRVAVVLLPGLCMLTAASHDAAARTLSLPELVAASERCAPDVAPITLASVAMTESRLDTLAVHDNTTGESFAPRDDAEAGVIVDKLLAGGHSVDAGLMQINSANFRRLGLTSRSVFDACASLAAGARVLAENYGGGDGHGAQQQALRASLSAYNTGSTSAGLRNGYVRKVELAASHLVPALDVGQGAAEPRPQAAPAAQATADAQPAPSWNVWDPDAKTNDTVEIQ